MAEDLAMLQKVLDMMEYAYICMRQFPKSEKYALATDIKRCMDSILHNTVAAKKRYFKKTTLQELDIEIATLQSYIRLSYKLGFLPIQKYQNWSDMVVELGKMLGGWLKTVKSQQTASHRE